MEPPSSFLSHGSKIYERVCLPLWAWVLPLALLSFWSIPQLCFYVRHLRKYKIAFVTQLSTGGRMGFHFTKVNHLRNRGTSPFQGSAFLIQRDSILRESLEQYVLWGPRSSFSPLPDFFVLVLLGWGGERERDWKLEPVHFLSLLM